MCKQAKVPNSLLFSEVYVSAIAIPVISIIKKTHYFNSCGWIQEVATDELYEYVSAF